MVDADQQGKHTQKQTMCCHVGNPMLERRMSKMTVVKNDVLTVADVVAEDSMAVDLVALGRIGRKLLMRLVR